MLPVHIFGPFGPEKKKLGLFVLLLDLFYPFFGTKNAFSFFISSLSSFFQLFHSLFISHTVFYFSKLVQLRDLLNFTGLPYSWVICVLHLSTMVLTTYSIATISAFERRRRNAVIGQSFTVRSEIVCYRFSDLAKGQSAEIVAAHNYIALRIAFPRPGSSAPKSWVKKFCLNLTEAGGWLFDALIAKTAPILFRNPTFIGLR